MDNTQITEKDSLHEEQKRIDCLDYLIWQMEKPEGKRKEQVK